MPGPDKNEIRDRVRRRALALLARREHTILELEQKLDRRLDVADGVVPSVVQELADRNLVSNERYADAFVRDAVRMKPRSARRLERELLERGVSSRVARAAVQAVFDDLDVDDGRLAAAVADAYHARVADAPPATQWRRISGHLQRRGFANALIYDTCAALVPEPASEVE
jgi:SOS response regulatory protein OraA/RecX